VGRKIEIVGNASLIANSRIPVINDAMTDNNSLGKSQSFVGDGATKTFLVTPSECPQFYRIRRNP